MPNKSNSIHIWRKGKRRLIIAIFGFFLGIFGILCGMFWDDIFNRILMKELTLRPNSQLYDKWKTPPIPLNLDIYLFNWTNPEDFNNLTTKPILEQLGPYRFSEKSDKVDIQWHPENASVTYRRRSLYYFDAAGSNGSLDDIVVTLNAVALSAAGKAKQWNLVRRSMVDVGLKVYVQQMSVMKTVDELLFTGYSEDLIDMARTMNIFGDITVPFDKFGWFYTRNGSAELTGVFNIHTGADDITKVGQMHSWNYKTHTGFFDSYCGLTNGSAGELQPPNLEINGSVSLFTPDICRTVKLDYVQSEEVEGILGYKYSGGLKSVDNGTLNPENECFCGGECVPSGVMNISACRFDSPVFMSYPHFYNADPVYLNQVEGLSSNKDEHEFYMILEPKTGVTLEAGIRYQVNMLVEPIEGIELYTNIPKIFFPLIWFGVKARITPDLAAEIKMLPIFLIGGQILACVCFAIGLIMLCWYPIEQLLSRTCNSERSIKTVHVENVRVNGDKSRPTNVIDETKMKQERKGIMETNSQLLADNSPLLNQIDSKGPNFISK